MDWQAGHEDDLGEVRFTQKEIIRFATHYDPLDFHMDAEAARNSIFGRLVASGPHIFHFFYKNRWLPIYKSTVLAGLELDKWKLLAPVYPDTTYHGKSTIRSVKKNELKKHASIQWNFEFTDGNLRPVQTLEMIVLHSLFRH